jgi:hypothetical protein
VRAEPDLGLDAPQQKVVDAFLSFSARGGGERRRSPRRHGRKELAALFSAPMTATFRRRPVRRVRRRDPRRILYHLFPAFSPWAGVGTAAGVPVAARPHAGHVLHGHDAAAAPA